MMTKKIEIWRLINPVTDFPAVIAIVLGLTIAIFIDVVAIRLIGICVAILGVVALFMIFSQRMKDLALHATRPSSASETTSFKTTVKQDPTTKRLIFDDFADSFGGDDFANDESEETQAREPLIPPARPLADRAISAPDEAGPIPYEPVDTDNFDDGVEGFRIIGPKNDNAKGQNGRNAAGTPTETPGSTPKTQTAPTREQEQNRAATGSEVKTRTTDADTGQQAPAPHTPQENRAAADTPAHGAKTAADKTAGVSASQAKAPAAESKKGSVLPDAAPKSSPKTEEKPVPATARRHSPEVPETLFADLDDYPRKAETAAAKGEHSPEEGAHAVGHKRKKLDIQLTEIFEASLDTLKKEPRKEFDYLLSRVLLVIRSVMSARTAIFLWVNFEKQELKIESRISDIEEALQDKPKVAFGNDVITQIAVNGAPEILTEINPNAELDLIPYYKTKSKTRSFVGVPVYYNNTVVGILTADTDAEDAYDSQSVSFLGHFTKLISGLIQGYTEKYDLMQSARTLESIDTFRKLTNDPRNTREDICFSLIDTLIQMVPFSVIGICMYNEQSGRWRVSEMRSQANAGDYNGAEVNLANSLIGQTITTGEIRQFRDIAPDVVRVSPAEQPLKSSVYTFIPLKSYSRCYGAVFVESPTGAELTKQDIQILGMLTEYAGSILEQMQLNALLQSHALIDESTGVLNASAFLKRLREEYVRATDMELSLTVCLFAVDQYATVESSLNAEAAEITTNHVLNVVREHLRPYDLLGRYNPATLGVGLIQKNSQEAQLWAERLRKECAGSVLAYNNRQFSVTISVGVAEYTNQQTFEDLLNDAEQVLHLAARKTNAVVVYS